MIVKLISEIRLINAWSEHSSGIVVLCIDARMLYGSLYGVCVFGFPRLSI